MIEPPGHDQEIGMPGSGHAIAPAVRTDIRWPSVNDHKLSGIILLAAVLLFVHNVLSHWTYLEDDPLIVFRYAINFHAGLGWVVNSGQRVNGCTSWFGLFLVTGLTEFLSSDQAVVALKVLGMGCGMIVLWKSQQLARILLPEATTLTALAPLLLAYRSDFALSMTNGLETSFGCAFLLCGLIALQRAWNEDHRYSEWTGLLYLVLAGLSRPELSVLYPLLVGIKIWNKERVNYRAAALYFLPFTIVGLFSLVFYHSLLPNTYFAKRVDVPTGLIYGGAYAMKYLMAPTVLVPGLFSLLCLGAAAARPARFNRIFFVTLALYLAFLLRTSGDWMVDGRLAMPILPLAVVSWLVGLRVAYVEALVVRKISRALYFLVVGTGLTLLTLGGYCDSRQRDAAIAKYSRIRSIGNSLQTSAPLSEWMCGAPDGRRKVADWIAQNVKPGQTVAMPEMGLITCLNPGVNFMDLDGLTDTTIARLPGYLHTPYGAHVGLDWDNLNSSMGQYLESKRPDYVVSIWTNTTVSRNPRYKEAAVVHAYADNSGWHDFAIYQRSGEL